MLDLIGHRRSALVQEESGRDDVLVTETELGRYPRPYRLRRTTEIRSQTTVWLGIPHNNPPQ